MTGKKIVKAKRLLKGRVSSKAYNVVCRQHVHRSVLIQMRDLAKEYGGMGRTLQVGMEMLVRHRVHIELPTLTDDKHGVSFKVPMRTKTQIDRLSPLYLSKGNVIHAAVLVLSTKPAI